MEEKKSILQSFFEQLGAEEQALVREYLQEKSLDSLSKAFDVIIEPKKNEAKQN